MKVEITEQTYYNYKILMGYLRLNGLLPVRVQKEGTKLFLHFSHLYLVLWWLFCGFFIATTIWGTVLDSKSKSDSVQLEADTDKLMILMQAIQYCAIVVVGTFVNSCRFKRFFDYIKCINEVDSVIKTTYEKSEKYKLLAAIVLIIAYNAFFGWLYVTGCYVIFGDSLSLFEVLKRYTSVNVVAYFSWVSEYMNLVMLNSLERRIKKLNNLLSTEYNNLTYGSYGRVSKRFLRRPIDRRVRIMRLYYRKNGIITELSRVYLKIMDAADILNEFLSISFLVTTAAVFWALIYILYFFTLSLTHGRGESARNFELVLEYLQLAAHTMRALIIINPAYACVIQVETTKQMVCKLLSCNVTKRYRQQLDAFAVVLGLRELEFSGCGFLIIDRLLFTSLIDTITTILMVLFQYRSTFEVDF